MCMSYFTPHRAHTVFILKQPDPKPSLQHGKKMEQQLTYVFCQEVQRGVYDNPAIYHPALTALLKLAAANMYHARAFAIGWHQYMKRFPVCDVIEDTARAFIGSLHDPNCWTPASQERYFLGNESTHFVTNWMARLPEKDIPPEVLRLLHIGNPNWFIEATARHQKAQKVTSRKILEINAGFAATLQRKNPRSEASRQSPVQPNLRGQTFHGLAKLAMADPLWQRAAMAIANGYTLEDIRVGPPTLEVRRPWKNSYNAWVQNPAQTKLLFIPDITRLPGPPQKRAKRLAEQILRLIIADDVGLAAYLNLTPAPAMAAA